MKNITIRDFVRIGKNQRIMNTYVYPDFKHPSSALSAFSFSIDSFIISLKTGEIVHFIPEDAAAFKQWIVSNGVRDINENDGIPDIVRTGRRIKEKTGY